MGDDLFQLRTCLRHEIPAPLACQIRSYTRVQWPGTNVSTTLWGASAEDRSSTHFLLTDGELLVAHASTRTRIVTHCDSEYAVAGLSTVFCYPDYRGRGLGERIASVATDFIAGSGADVAMLFCGDRVRSLYLRLGWEHVAAARITYGDPPTPKMDNRVLMLFLSEEGRSARRVFETETVHVGPSTW
jgi:predicted N-acetyltransferase YhbS